MNLKLPPSQAFLAFHWSAGTTFDQKCPYDLTTYGPLKTGIA